MQLINGFCAGPQARELLHWNTMFLASMISVLVLVQGNCSIATLCSQVQEADRACHGYKDLTMSV